MSRLLPKDLSLGLFPGQCWLRTEQGTFAPTLETEPDPGGESLLVSLARVLDEHRENLPKGRAMSLLVCDGAASFAVLPWQESLTRTAELQAYAKAHFESLGAGVDDSWVLHADFRHFGGMGLAFAFPRQWMQQLVELLAERGVALRHLVPISAMAYWKQRLPAKEQRALALQSERGRHSALVFDRTGLIGMDVEPCLADAEVAGMRLLRRIDMRFGEVQSVGHWMPVAADVTPSRAFISACIPDAAVHVLHRESWS